MNPHRMKKYNDWRVKFQEDPAKAVGWRNKQSLDARFACTFKHLAHKDLKGLKVLDFGCGSSLNFMSYAPPIYFSYIGVDCNIDSLEYASDYWSIPIVESYDSSVNYQLICDEKVDKLEGLEADIILVQGVYQEFDNITSIRENVKKLSELLAPGGEILIMTPCNRCLEAEGDSVLKISPYDAISILDYTGLPYELYLGEFGEHLILRAYKEKG